MGLLDIFFSNKEKKCVKKRVFISFAIEDVNYRDYLVQQSKKSNSPFNFIDMSVKKEWEQDEWKKKCRTKIKRCHGVIALLSKNTHKAGGARWEIKCAKQENIPLIGVYMPNSGIHHQPEELYGINKVDWTWQNIAEFVNNL
jgi:hypothetical protein